MGREVDRVPFIKLFGDSNAIHPHWEREHPGIAETIDEILEFEGAYRGWGIAPVTMGLSNRGKPLVVEDTTARRVQRYCDGTVEVFQKSGDFGHQTIEWPVKNRTDWQRVKAKHLQADDPTRFDPDWPKQADTFRKRDYPLQLTHHGVYGFARILMGDVRLLYAFCEEPDLVHDIMDYYTDMVLAIWENMVEELDFELIECWEDMASKNGSLVSPWIFREFMAPNYQKIAAFAKRHGIEIVLVDSDGWTDHLAGLMVEAGVTAMYPFEVGAGCDLHAVRGKYPTFGILGGLAKEAMREGRRAIDEEIEKARGYIEQLGRYIPGPDHFVLSDTSWENYKYFMQGLNDVVMETKPKV